MSRAIQMARRQLPRRASTLSALVVLAVFGAIGCGPSDAEIAAKDQTLVQLRVENSTLRERVRELETAAQQSPDVLLSEAREAERRQDYASALRAAELLVEKHPSSDRVQAARKVATNARRRLADQEAKRRAEAEREATRQTRAAEAARRTKEREVRTLLHRNLDGAGDGFVVGWQWSGETFVLVIDERKYVPNSAVVAAITARSIFDTEGVPLPKTLVFRDRQGKEMDRGPFANVPRLVP